MGEIEETSESVSTRELCSQAVKAKSFHEDSFCKQVTHFGEVGLGFFFHASLKQFGKWMGRTKKKALLAALDKIKEELMLFGFIFLPCSSHFLGFNKVLLCDCKP
ncbi:hypothetical protein CsSME_00020195 [Camellia sinensis var. sinensis]